MNFSTYQLVGFAVALSAASAVFGMSGSQHVRLTKNLMGTPVAMGGVGDMTMDRIRSITRWIDHPATTPGRYRVSSDGGRWLTPSNHGGLRHDPWRVARVFSGNGSVDPAARNVSLYHNLADFASNKRPVNGFNITPARRATAMGLLDSVKRTRRLPANLPNWIEGTSAARHGKVVIVRPGGPFPWPPEWGPYRRTPLRTAVKGAAFGGGLVFVVDGGFEVCKYLSGLTGHGDLKAGLKEAVVRAAAVGSTTATLYLVCASPQGVIVFAVGAAAWMAADYGIDACRDHFGLTPLALEELRGILPDEVIEYHLPADLFLTQQR